MVKITTSVPFRKKIIAQAEDMISRGIAEESFADEGKVFEGMVIFLDKKPASTLFSFSFPDGPYKNKKIFVGNDK